MADNNKGGCLGWFIILTVLGTILGGIQECSNRHHKRQDLILPEYSFFNNWDGDPKITFQTFGDNRKDLACLNYEYKSGSMAEMYVIIKNGNDLFDADDNFVGYVVVNKDGSINIKGSKTASGHYVGSNGAKASFVVKKANDPGKKNKEEKLDWLNGTWTATNTPVGDATIIIKGNNLTEKISGATKKGTFTIGDNYIQVKYNEGWGVRLDLDRNNKRIGLGEGWWLSKENKGAADGNSYHISSGLDAVSPSVQNVQSDSMDYRFLSERLLTEFDLQGLSKNDIRLMRNAIFARHGYIFKNKELADYFSSMDWYEPRYSDVTSMLTEIELKNIEFLKKHE